MEEVLNTKEQVIKAAIDLFSTKGFQRHFHPGYCQRNGNEHFKHLSLLRQ